MISPRFRFRPFFNISNRISTIQSIRPLNVQRIYQNRNDSLIIVISRGITINNQQNYQNYQSASNDSPRIQILTEDLDALLPHDHPPSVSYFTARPTYNDLFVNLDDLISKYGKYPKRQRADAIKASSDDASDANNVNDINNVIYNDNINDNSNNGDVGALKDSSKPEPVTLWKLKNQLEVDLGLNLKSNQYKQIIRKLNRLAQIDPELTPRLQDFLVIFKRRDLEKAKKELQASKTLDKFGRAYAVGRRKQSVAHVWLVKGEGHVWVNGKPLANYFKQLKDKKYVQMPLQVTNLLGKYNVWIRVKGGGTTGN